MVNLSSHTEFVEISKSTTTRIKCMTPERIIDFTYLLRSYSIISVKLQIDFKLFEKNIVPIFYIAINSRQCTCIRVRIEDLQSNPLKKNIFHVTISI